MAHFEKSNKFFWAWTSLVYPKLLNICYCYYVIKAQINFSFKLNTYNPGASKRCVKPYCWFSLESGLTLCVKAVVSEVQHCCSITGGAHASCRLKSFSFDSQGGLLDFCRETTTSTERAKVLLYIKLNGTGFFSGDSYFLKKMNCKAPFVLMHLE